jgi:hypothetical protein
MATDNGARFPRGLRLDFLLLWTRFGCKGHRIVTTNVRSKALAGRFYDILFHAFSMAASRGRTAHPARN